MLNYLRSFAGGEVTPELFGRIDHIGNQTGLALCQNLVVLPHGPVRNRPGSGFLAISGTAGAPTLPPRLITFKFSSTQEIVLEMGVALSGLGYIRFFINGAVVLHGQTPAAWSNVVTYTAGQWVSFGGAVYQAIPNSVANLNKQPDIEPNFWHVMPASGVYEARHPYSLAQLPFVRYFQSLDVITLLHRDVPPRELRRYGSVDWRVELLTAAPALATPGDQDATVGSVGVKVQVTGVAALGTGIRVTVNGQLPWIEGESIYGQLVFTLGNTVGPRFFRASRTSVNNVFDLLELDGTLAPFPGAGAFQTAGSFFQAVPQASESQNNYRVSAVDANGNESFVPIPAEASIGNNLFAEGAYNIVDWNEVAGATSYRIYKKLSGLYGLIGTVTADSISAGVGTFKDDNIAPDFSQGHLFPDTTLTVSPYPEAGCYHEQRRFFGVDQLIRATRSGTEKDLSYHIPVLDDDRISFQIASTEFSPVQHMVSMADLIVLTSSIEYVATPPDDTVLTPSSIMQRPHSFIGSSHIRPVIMNNVLVFAATRGGHLREMTYKVTSQGYLTGDLSSRAPHLFDNLTIVDLALSKAPYPIVWAVSSTGKLLGLTYMPDQEVMGWHQHTLGGADAFVESCAVVNEGNEDSLYLVVRRTVNVAGVPTSVRYIERLSTFAIASFAHSVFVDSSKTFTSFPIPGGALLHLAGKVVSILADGIVLPQQTVDNSGNLPNPPTGYTRVTVGLPIDVMLQTLPVAMQIDGLGQGQTKAVNNVFVRVVNSAPFRSGPAANDLAPSDSTAPSMRGLLVAETPRTERVRVLQPNAWANDAQVFIKHSTPLPLTVVGVTLEVVVGD